MIFRSPLLKLHCYHNKRLQVKESQYLILTHSWTLTSIPNWTCFVVTVPPFDAQLPSTMETVTPIQMETIVSHEYLAGKAFPWDTRETFCVARLYYLIHTFCTYCIYTHITHKWEGEPLRENSSKNTWELEIVIPTFLYTFVYGISSSPTSPFPYHWEVDSPNIYHTHSECQVIVWCCWEALEEAKDGRYNMELVAGSGELDKTRFREALLE